MAGTVVTRVSAASHPTSSSSARRGTLLASIATALLLSACATPPAPSSRTTAPVQPTPAEQAVPITPRMQAARAALDTMVTQQDRLYRVAAPLLINNVDLCRTAARGLLGFTAKNKWSYPGEYADAAAAVLGYDDALRVSGVLAGSGAARAGLRKGDTLVAADGKALPTGPGAETAAAGVFAPLVSGRTQLSMTIGRDGQTQVLKVPVTRACAMRVDLGNADNVNSYADGGRIAVTRGMINFAGGDEAIAYVLAKDIAHNVLGHAAVARNTAAVAAIIDNVTRVQPDQAQLGGSGNVKPLAANLEVAADTLALYMLARAGYGVERYKAFWQKLAAQYPASVPNGYMAVHPNLAPRLAAIDKTVADIKAKQAAKKPLVP
ncbi:M48 family metallopeptidase [Pseudoduganella sp. SL102]|uniref:M48 family metallopeptidase n=1 Tax=Pseudoduganella sp. SL102 TaxID=2995154 RepID=UPI00248CDE1B|nr:M48 family metallopeptidase [Pseudoduganella sp. SL102]WBS01834.1 M48 family metallopeptidase [Pseudoduganella sp. SL102]